MRTRFLAPVAAITLALTVAVGAGVAQGGTPAAPAAAPHHTTPKAKPAVPAKVLLTKQQTDVLGKQIAYPTQQPAQVSSSIVTLLPGQSTGRHKHDAPMYAYVLRGTLTVAYDGGVTKVYRQGEAIMEAVDVWHNGTNKGHRTVQVLVVNIGAEGVDNTVKP